MPLKVQNYGEWLGDKPGGHHPPACTCVDCNEGRKQQEAAIGDQRAKDAAVRQAEDALRQAARPRAKHAAKPKQPPAKPKSVAQPKTTAQPRSVAQPKTTAQPRSVAQPRRPLVRPAPAQSTQAAVLPRRRYRRRERPPSNLLRRITATTLRYALAVHVATVAGLAVYTVIQAGAADVLPTLADAGEAYGTAWASMVSR